MGMERGQRDGQMLIEVLVALTVLVLVTVAVANVSTKSLKSVRVANNKQEALTLAKTVLDGIEKDKLTDIKGFFTGGNGDEDCSSGEYTCVAGYTFDSPPDSNKVEVEVKVTWQESGRDFSVSLNRVFTKVRL